MRSPSDQSGSGTIGIVIVGHGERGGHADNQVLLMLRERVAAETGVPAVDAGVLNGEPTLNQALGALAQRGVSQILLYPFFMSDGYFVRTALPERIARSGVTLPWRILPPLGLDPAMPALIVARAIAEAYAAEWVPLLTRLLIVGHGSSKSRASAEATELVADAVRNSGEFHLVETAFLEEPPFIAERISGDQRHTVVVGFFSAEGLHARDDIPAALAGTHARYTGPIGADPAIAGIAASAIMDAIRLEKSSS